MKRSHFLTLLLILIGSVVAQAQVQTVYYNGLWYKLYLDRQIAVVVKKPTYKNVTITHQGKPKKKVEVPEYVIYGDPLDTERIPCWVIGIGVEAFENNENLTEIELPETILFIDNLAFGGCTKLKKIALPSGMRQLGGGAFFSCKSLQDIVIPDSLEYIGSGAFDGCKNLKSVEWNAVQCSLSPLDNDTVYIVPFNNCPKLSHFTFAEKVEYIPQFLLFGNPAVKEISIPQSVTEIGEYAFANCKKLRHVRFQNSLGTRANQETWFIGTSANIESVLMPGETVSIIH